MTYPNVQLYINGQWRNGASGETLGVLNPATGQELGRIAVATKADLDEAVEAAYLAFQSWKRTPAVDRAKIMREAARLMRERAEETARLMTLEQGKPFMEAKIETLFAADVIEYFAEEGKRVAGRIVQPRSSSSTLHVHKEPVGVVAAFTPWNFPINQVVRKLSAALTTGCTFIVKAPEETPASPAAMIACFIDAGVPKGVVNLVYGNPAEISAHLIAHPKVRKVTFTGSTPVGKQLAAMAGLHMKRATMELGGHAPVIVMDDFDVARAAKLIAGVKLRNAGQVCISPTRFLVQNSVKKAFVSELKAALEAVKIGNGLEKDTTLGPLANARRITAMETLTQDAVKHGAKLITGGQRVGNVGNFYMPTVLDDVTTDMRIMNEEPFGPIAPIMGFDKLEDAILEANRLPFGLAAYAFSNSAKNLHTLSEGMETGMLWLNQPAPAVPEMPFGGVKDSGYGSEGGAEALDAYLVTKSVTTQY